jgi:hypothetical protein
MKRSTNQERGSGLLTVMSVTAVLLLLVASLFYMVQRNNANAIDQARALPRSYCADTGLQMARAYFGTNFANWNAYLADPSHYNPVVASWNPSSTAANPTSLALQAAHPELFIDLDGDGQADVYLYVRDNPDELPPATENYLHDNDMQVFVGAVCISSTLVPRRSDGSVDPSRLSAEALLVYNGINAQYAQRCQAQGNCNVN